MKAKTSSASDDDAVLQDREDLLVGAVAGLELAVFSVER
jgi:hypothetical protein